MCGLLGIAGNIEYKDIEVFEDLFHVSALRGKDSSGIAVFTRKTDGDPFQAHLLKGVGPSANLLDYKGWDKAKHNTNKKIMMGHTRHATKGSVTLNNSHPFEFSQIVGSHNGTLDWTTQRELPFHNYFDTDSEALVSAINDKSIQEVIGTQEGAWALNIVNKTSGTLNFLRNKERDLCFVFNKNHTTLYWASEPGFLLFVLDRRQIERESKVVYRFTEDTLYTWDIPINGRKFDNPDKEIVKGLVRKPYERDFSVWHGNGRSSASRAAAERVFMPNNQKKTQEQSNIVRLLTKHNIAPPDKSDIHISISQLHKFHPDFYELVGKKRHKNYLFINQATGKKWSQNMFLNSVTQGCAFCTEVPSWGDNIVFPRGDAFTCQKCSGDDGISEAIKHDIPNLPVQGADDLNDQLPIIN